VKILFIFNNNSWTTIPHKTEEIKKFFAPKLALSIDTKFTNFINIPFETVTTLDGTGHQDGTDVQSSAEVIDGNWYNQNISIPNSSYDITVFCVSDSDKVGHVTPNGIRGDKDQGPVELCIFGGDENWRSYVNGVDKGNNFVSISCHEISHALYMLYGKTDNTHKYFYTGTPEKVLEDFGAIKPNTVDILSAKEKLRNYLLQLIGLYQKQLDDLIKAQQSNKLDLFCKAIEKHEGYFPPSVKYPKGSVAWRNKNPFNLRYAFQPKSIGKDSLNFAVFKTYEDGFTTGKQMIINAITGKSKVYKPDDTILQFFGKYAPSFENDTLRYAEMVAKAVGVPITFKIKDLL